VTTERQNWHNGGIVGEEIEMLDVNGHLVRVNVVVALLAIGDTLTRDRSVLVPCGSSDANYPGWVEARIVAEP
jgi:hypothetical protein